MNETIDRRSFLRKGSLTTAGLVAAGTGLPALLSACGSSKSSSSSTTIAASSATTVASGSTGSVAPGTYGSLAFQLSWVENVEFAGEYIADTNGYYTQQGLTVDLLTGGPTVAQDAVVAAGKAFSGISSPDITGPAIVQGAPLIIVAAQYQKNPFAIMSLAKTPINNPQEMIGKKIGIQSTNQAVWNSFLKANNIKASSITEVPVQFDPSPLAAGQVDGWFSFITNEPLELAAKGVQTVTFLLNDYNYPLVSETYMVNPSVLSDATQRAKLKAFLVAEIMGWHQALQNPALGAQLAVNVYGKSLGNTVTEQTGEALAENKLILDARTTTEGILTITPEQAAQNVTTLAIGGTNLTVAKLFDLTVMDEVYAEHPELKTV